MTTAEDRYDLLTTKTLPNGNQVYAVARPRVVAVDQLNDFSMMANIDDRMDIIAKNVYGSPQDWWRVAQGNQTVNGSLFLTPGLQLFIPKSTA